MNSWKCNLNGRHAPGYLRRALIEALESAWKEHRRWWSLIQIEFLDPAEQAHWDHSTAVARANWLLGQLWNCGDITPGDISMMGFNRASTYARLARGLKSEMRISEIDPGASGRGFKGDCE
jgi:hypothetical protein